VQNPTQAEKVSLEKTLSTGMPVRAYLGYNGTNTLQFSGYINTIKPNQLLEIGCEDGFYKLKRSEKINTVFNGSLQAMLKQYLPQATQHQAVPNVTLTNFVVQQATQAELLAKLSEAYGLSAYFVEADKLYVGLPHLDTTGRRCLFHFQRNIVSSQLIYNKADDVRIQAKAISLLRDNTTLDVQVGDKEGEQRTLHFYEIRDKAQLTKFAENTLSQLKFEGYRGSFTAFGWPEVALGDVVVLYDRRYAERQGQSYLIENIEKEWGDNGYRQTITLSNKLQ